MVCFTMFNFKSALTLLFSVLVYAIIVQAQGPFETVDDGDASILYSPSEGIWNSIGDSLAAGGASRRAQDASASATISHEFTTFRFVAPLWPYPAKMQITIDDGAAQVIDLQDYTAAPGDPSGPSTQQAAVRYTSPGMTIGEHRIVFSPVPNSDRPFVVVDSLEFSQVPVPVGPGGGPGGNPGGGPGGPGGGPGSGTGTGGGTGGGPGTGGGSTSGGSGNPSAGGSSGGSTTGGTSGGSTSASGSNSITTTPSASSTNSATSPGDSSSPTANPGPVDAAAAEKRPNRGLIGGLSAMGIIILLVILAGVALFLRRRRQKQRQRRLDYATDFKPTLIDGPPVLQNPENGQHGVLVAQSEKDVEGYFGAAAASAPSISPSTSTTSPTRVPVPYHLAAIPTVSLVTQPITLDGNDAIPRRSGVFDDGGPVRTSLAPSDMTNPAVFYDARSTPTPTGAAQPQPSPPAPPSESGSASTFSPPPSTEPTAERTTPPGARPPSILPGTANSNPFASSRDELTGLTTPGLSSGSDGMPERESQQLSLATRDSVAERIWDNVTPAVRK
ncbi:hypothetical protein BJ165DRAFT_1508437 [Panaeolus papilionaceus]|nr:hypothetical protein BJ165DRAFT_1508437 [Panaeolus papilionaceus]